MTDPAAFTLADNWKGGYYELALELGPADDTRLDRAVRTLWELTGSGPCYGSGEREPAAQAPVPCTLESLRRSGHLRGTVTLPAGARVVCGVVAVREDESGSDWLDFYLPLGALAAAEPRVGGFPFDGGASLAWRRPIDDWLADIGRTLFASVDYRLGLIGFEASGVVHAAELTTGPAEPRAYGYLVPAGPEVRYLPAQ